MMELYERYYRKAVKEHECEFCGKVICIGEKYSCEKGKYDGEFFTRKLCMVCDNILKMYCIGNNNEEFTYWELHDWLVDERCSKCEHKNIKCDTKAENCPLVRMIYRKEDEAAVAEEDSDLCADNNKVERQKERFKEEYKKIIDTYMKSKESRKQ